MREKSIGLDQNRRAPGSSNLRRLLRDRRGATAIEYGFILALVVLAVMASIVSLGNVTTAMWNDVSAKVINAR